jgi:hypothetical protein
VENYRQSAGAAARTLGITVVFATWGNAAHIEGAFAERVHEGSGGIIGIPDTFINEHRDLTIELVRCWSPSIVRRPSLSKPRAYWFFAMRYGATSAMIMKVLLPDPRLSKKYADDRGCDDDNPAWTLSFCH